MTNYMSRCAWRRHIRQEFRLERLSQLAWMKASGVKSVTAVRCYLAK